MKTFLGIDIGTSSVKIIAINETLDLIGESSYPYPTDYPKPFWSEQDPELWWQATKIALNQLLSLHKILPETIAAIGLTGQMHSLVAIDHHNQIIRNAILWNDQRSSFETKYINEIAGGQNKLIDLVANRSITGFTLSKLLWLKHNESANFAQIHKILLPKDEIRRRLTNDYATDVSDASGTLMFDVKNRKWSNEILELFKINPKILPHVYESAQITGYVSQLARNELGLNINCPVVAGAGDCIAAAIGLGVVDDGILAISLGTSGILMASTSNPLIDYSGRLHSFCHGIEHKWHIMGVNLTGGGSLKWFKEALYPDDDKFYDAIDHNIKDINPGSSGLFFLPYLNGERTPHFNANAHGAYIGLTLKHNKGHFLRALMEGVAYNLRQTLEIMKEIPIPISQIRVTGGGLKNQLWLNILSDILGYNLIKLKSDQGPAIGAALLAGQGSNYFNNIEDNATRLAKSIETVQVNETNHQFYQHSYRIFQDLYKALENPYNEIANLYNNTNY